MTTKWTVRMRGQLWCNIIRVINVSANGKNHNLLIVYKFTITFGSRLLWLCCLASSKRTWWFVFSSTIYWIFFLHKCVAHFNFYFYLFILKELLFLFLFLFFEFLAVCFMIRLEKKKWEFCIWENESF